MAKQTMGAIKQRKSTDRPRTTGQLADEQKIRADNHQKEGFRQKEVKNEEQEEEEEVEPWTLQWLR